MTKIETSPLGRLPIPDAGNKLAYYYKRLGRRRGETMGEHLIREMRGGKQALSQKWRGSFSLLSAIARIAAHMTGLQERILGSE